MTETYAEQLHIHTKDSKRRSAVYSQRVNPLPSEGGSLLREELMSDFSHAYTEGRDEGYQQAVSDLLEAARARLRAHPECSGQALVDWLSEEVKERKPDGKPVF